MTQITLGGERLGSGKKNKIYLRNYERSTHNLSKRFASTMGVGMLIPFYENIITRDDKFEIDLAAGLRTIPTKGPLFGSFKLQVDMFQCPLRLYQALLHNNPMALGLKTNQVKWPKIKLYDYNKAPEYKLSEAGKNSLVKYLGIGGMGTLAPTETLTEFKRDFFGAGLLAYYDIFKNYYANKQEENAYTLGEGRVTIDNYKLKYYRSADAFRNTLSFNSTVGPGRDPYIEVNTDEDENRDIINFYFDLGEKFMEIKEDDILGTQCTLYYESEQTQPIRAYVGRYNNSSVSPIQTFYKCDEFGVNNVDPIKNKYLCIVVWNTFHDGPEITRNPLIKFSIAQNGEIHGREIILKPFPLENIDKMRYDILSFHQLGESFIIDTFNGSGTMTEPPYTDALLDDNTVEEQLYWKKQLSGICVKTYQNDLFNNWINTEWIDGENGIAEITAIATTEGSIKMDALLFSEKLYNLLNRVAASDGTYEGYLDVVYTESAKRFCESPMWIGGLSDEVVFEEIVQTAPADGDPLGTLGGRGLLRGKHKGGKITVKIDEPSLLIGIVSITPRVMYTQGNKWFNTELDSLADIHVPGLDGIAFQNLMAEQMHYGATVIENDGETIQTRQVVGKVPAWINYMTDIDEAYGDFAATGGDGYMILNRNYEVVDGELQDATTYIDPAKYNYCFAYTKRDAQNFWVSINVDVKARRLMSAKQIPTI